MTADIKVRVIFVNSGTQETLIPGSQSYLIPNVTRGPSKPFLMKNVLFLKDYIIGWFYIVTNRFLILSWKLPLYNLAHSSFSPCFLSKQFKLMIPHTVPQMTDHSDLHPLRPLLQIQLNLRTQMEYLPNPGYYSLNQGWGTFFLPRAICMLCNIIHGTMQNHQQLACWRLTNFKPGLGCLAGPDQMICGPFTAHRLEFPSTAKNNLSKLTS